MTVWRDVEQARIAPALLHSLDHPLFRTINRCYQLDYDESQPYAFKAGYYLETIKELEREIKHQIQKGNWS